MPSRYVIAAIVVFWLATTAWLFQREIWPRLQSGEPPAFIIDLADEASEQKVFWSLSQDGRDKGFAHTWVQYHDEDDTFELMGLYKFFQEGRGREKLSDMELQCAYRVSRDGELRQIHAHLNVPVFAISAQGDGSVVHGQLVLHIRVTVLNPITGQNQIIVDKDLAALHVPARASILNPRQPVNRLLGIHPGQSWWMPFWDPVDDALASFSGGKAGMQLLQVRVTDRPEVLTRGQKEDTCLVVEYFFEKGQGRIWVRQSDGLVLRQEAAIGNETLVQTRDQP